MSRELHLRNSKLSSWKCEIASKELRGGCSLENPGGIPSSSSLLFPLQCIFGSSTNSAGDALHPRSIHGKYPRRKSQSTEPRACHSQRSWERSCQELKSSFNAKPGSLSPGSLLEGRFLEEASFPSLQLRAERAGKPWGAGMRNLGIGYEIHGEIPVLWGAWSSSGHQCQIPASISHRDEARIPQPCLAGNSRNLHLPPSTPLGRAIPAASCIPPLPRMIPSSRRQGRFLWTLSFSSREESLLGDVARAPWLGWECEPGEVSQLRVHPEVLGRVAGLQSRLHPRGFFSGISLPWLAGVTAGSPGAIQGILEHPKAAGASLSTSGSSRGGLGLWGISPRGPASLWDGFGWGWMHIPGGAGCGGCTSQWKLGVGDAHSNGNWVLRMKSQQELDTGDAYPNRSWMFGTKSH